MSDNRFGFIGFGNIAGAIAHGMLASGYIKPSQIGIYDLDVKKTEKLLGSTVYPDASSLVRDCKYVFLTVKPQVYPMVLEEIKGAVTPETCLITVAAGRTIAFVKEKIGLDCKVIRVMPNTPLMVGAGASALCKATPVTDEEFDMVFRCFSSCGAVCTVEEGQMDTVTAVSGSSPAFVFRFAQALINAGQAGGLSGEEAKKLVAGTLLGSAKMILESGRDIEALIRMVTSPNGTTEAGLRAMDAAGFTEAIKAAVEAAAKRSVELRV